MRGAVFANADSLVCALLHTLWQGGLIVLLLCVFLRLIPARRAQLRYLMSMAALAAVLLTSVFTWGWMEVSNSQNLSRASLAAPAVVSRSIGRAIEAHEASEKGTSVVAARPPAFRWGARFVVPREWAFRLVIIWGCGVLIFLTRCVTAVLGAERLCKQARDVSDSRILSVAESVHRGLRMERQVCLLVSETVNIPAVVGFLRPAVLLPASLISGLPPEYLRAVLAHEFAHIRRWDYLVNIGQMLVEALLFFNPFVWWISRQVRREREACCDLIASAHCQKPELYLEAVLACARHAEFSSLQESAVPLPSAALAMFGSKEGGNKPLLDRVKRLLMPGYNAGIRVPWMTMAAIFVISGAIFFSIMKGAILAAEILTPRQRIERIEQLKKELDLAVLKERDIEVSGVVVTEDGKPLANTTISIDSQRPHHGWAMSQYTHDGKFTARIQSGVVNLAAWAEGYPPVFAGPFRSDTDLKNLRLVLARGFQAKIHVTDPIGNPLEGAKLTGQYSGPPGTSQFTIVTDAKGNAVVQSASASRVAFDVIRNGFQTEHRDSLHLNAEKQIELTMVPSHPLKGRVVAEENGAPVPNAKISLLNVTGPYNISYSPQSLTVLTTTNDAGEFTVDTLRDDSAYWLHITAKDRRPTVSSEVTVKNGPVEMRMGSPLSLKGKIILPMSASHEATVEIRCDQEVETGNHRQGVGQTLQAPVHDKVASFAFGNLYAGEIRLMVNGVEVKQLPRFHDSVDDLEVYGSVQPFVKTEAIPKRNVIIRFEVPKEAPPPAGSLEVRYLENGSGPGIQRVLISRSVSIENGEARLELPVPNELEFSPEGLVGYSIPARSNVKLEAGMTPAEFRLQAMPAGSIYGEIAEADGAAAHDLFIYVIDTEKAPDNRPPVLNVKDQAGGNSDLVRQFVATPLPLGTEYAVLVSRGATYALGSAVRVDEKTPIQKVKMIVPEGKSLRGRVTDEAGNPVQPLEFGFTYSTPWQQSFSTEGYWTQGDGEFTIPHVNADVPGKYEIEFRTRSNYVPMSVVIDVSRPSSSIRLRKGKILEGSAVNVETGLPMSGVEVYALSEAPMAVMPGTASRYVVCEAEARTNGKGHFQFSNLPDGKFRLGCRHANFADQWDHTVIQGGQSEPVLLKLKPIPAR